VVPCRGAANTPPRPTPRGQRHFELRPVQWSRTEEHSLSPAPLESTERIPPGVSVLRRPPGVRSSAEVLNAAAGMLTRSSAISSRSMRLSTQPRRGALSVAAAEVWRARHAPGNSPVPPKELVACPGNRVPHRISHEPFHRTAPGSQPVDVGALPDSGQLTSSSKGVGAYAGNRVPHRASP